ncbi:MAG: G5 domain-containing protein [Anaerolineae bacterium]|nr:G5 domain-containing protein [Anaerolineae bacterium]
MRKHALWDFAWWGIRRGGLLLLSLMAACAPVGPLGAITVTLIVDGETRTLTTEAKTVYDVLVESGVTLGENDIVVPPENTFLSSNASIRVIRIDVQTETEQRIIPYTREVVRSTTVDLGETRLIQAGVNGIEEIIYAITLEDGVEVERRMIQRTILQEAVNEVMLIGAREEVVALPIPGTLAYLSAQNAWAMRNTTGNRRRLTSSGDLDGRVFDLSPDGTWLLFTRHAVTETDVLNTLWMVDTVTANAEPVRLNVDNVLWAAWDPSGEQIAFSTAAVQDTQPGWEAANDLYIARPRASDGVLVGRRQVLEPTAGGTYGWWGTTFAWAPPGASTESRMLAYARADEVGVVRVSDGATLPLLTFPPYRTYAAWVWTPTVAWSPDAAFIVTLAHGPAPAGEMPEDSPVFDLYVLGVAEVAQGYRSVLTGTLAAELASEVGMWSTPSFSVDGGRIFFGRARIPYNSNTSDYDLYVMDRDGSSRQPFFVTESHEPGLEYPTVAWDPAGEQAVVIFQGDMYLVTGDGQRRRLTEDGSVTQVRWTGAATAAEGD